MTTFGDRLYQLGGTPVGSDLLGLLGKGNVRFIDPNAGSDGNSGRKADQAWKTLQYAADQSGYRRTNADAEGSQDILLRLPGVEEVSSEIAFDGNYAATHVGNVGGANIAVVATTAGQRIFGDVLGQHTRAAAGFTTGNLIGIYYRAISFYGLSFGHRATGGQGDGTGAMLAFRVNSADPGVQSLGGGNFCMVRNCNFRDDGGLDATGIYAYGAGAIFAYQCTFGYYDNTRAPEGLVLRGSGSNNPFDFHVRECFFHTCPIGINFLDATVTGGTLIADNYFLGCTDAFHFAAGFAQTQPGFIVNNRFSTATGAASWKNDGGSGDTQGNVTTDTNFEFSGNLYDDDA